MSNIQVVRRSTAHATHIIDQLEDAVCSQEEMIQVLSYRSIDTEPRSRRNNIIFYNITKDSRHSSDKARILNFMENELDIDTSEMCIEGAHILGSLRQDTFRGRSDTRWPMVVKFRDNVDTEMVMKNANMLKNTRVGVYRDYPREIAIAIKKLYTCEEAKRARFDKSSVQIKYPARLYIDRKLVCDKFPEWFKIMGRNRLEESNRLNSRLDKLAYSKETIPDNKIESDDSEGTPKSDSETADESAVFVPGVT